MRLWIYRMLIVLLVVLFIDMNCDPRRSHIDATRMRLADFTVGGLLVVLFLLYKVKKKK